MCFNTYCLRAYCTTNWYNQNFAFCVQFVPQPTWNLKKKPADRQTFVYKTRDFEPPKTGPSLLLGRETRSSSILGKELLAIIFGRYIYTDKCVQLEQIPCSWQSHELFCLQVLQIVTCVCVHWWYMRRSARRRCGTDLKMTKIDTQTTCTNNTVYCVVSKRLTDTAQFCPFFISKRRHVQKNRKTSVHEEFNLLQTDVFLFFWTCLLLEMKKGQNWAALVNFWSFYLLHPFWICTKMYTHEQKCCNLQRLPTEHLTYSRETKEVFCFQVTRKRNCVTFSLTVEW